MNELFDARKLDEYKEFLRVNAPLDQSKIFEEMRKLDLSKSTQFFTRFTAVMKRDGQELVSILCRELGLESIEDSKEVHDENLVKVLDNDDLYNRLVKLCTSLSSRDFRIRSVETKKRKKLVRMIDGVLYAYASTNFEVCSSRRVCTSEGKIRMYVCRLRKACS